MQRKSSELENRMIDLKNRYIIFHDFDELDLLDALTIKISYTYQSEFEVEVLKLLDYLLKYNNDGGA